MLTSSWVPSPATAITNKFPRAPTGMSKTKPFAASKSLEPASSAPSTPHGSMSSASSARETAFSSPAKPPDKASSASTKPPGMLRSEDINATLSDEELIETFTALEKKFHQWYESGGYAAKYEVHGLDGLEDLLQEEFGPDSEILEKWSDFCEKWLARDWRKTTYKMPPEEFLRLVRSTPCKDSAAFAHKLWKFTMCNTPDLVIGESQFGGHLTGYGISTTPHVLYPDTPSKGVSDVDKQHLFDRAILTIHLDHDPSTPAVQASSSTAKIRSETWSSSTCSNRSSVSVENTKDGELLGTDSLCVLQIGTLTACTEREWLQIRSSGHAMYDGNWEDTGYAVVVKLDNEGHPTGAVYAVYNFQMPKEECTDTIGMEIESKDANGNDLPNIRRLYSGCEEKFFMAKIADQLEDLKADTQIDFDVIKRDRCTLARTMMDKSTKEILSAGVFGPCSSN